MPHVALAKAELAQGSERPNVHVQFRNRRRAAVIRSVSMLKPNARLRASDNQHTAMHRPVVRTAQREQVFGLVPAAILTSFDVMNIDERRMPTPRYPTAVVVSAQDRTSHGW